MYVFGVIGKGLLSVHFVSLHRLLNYCRPTSEILFNLFSLAPSPTGTVAINFVAYVRFACSHASRLSPDRFSLNYVFQTSRIFFRKGYNIFKNKNKNETLKISGEQTEIIILSRRLHHKYENLQLRKREDTCHSKNKRR